MVTLQTNQKALDDNNVSEASKSLRAFSLPTEKQAVGLARAWAPPMMMDFTDCPSCHICKRKFAVLCRACHCRNCGVCVCNDCAIQWPAKMIPDTYNVKKNYSVNVCKSCDWLCNAFRRALLEGKRDEAVALHSTGNINLRSSFANVKGELFFPVHCAVLGGNLQVLKWLVDEHCCPIKSVQICGISKDSGIKCTPIVTSKGRSLLGIAMETQNVAIVRYLVVDKDVRLAGEKDITAEMLLLNLDAVLRLLPYGGKETRSSEGDGSQEPYKIAVAAQQNSNTSSRDMIEESSDSGAIRGHHRNNSDSVDPTRFDECKKSNEKLSPSTLELFDIILLLFYVLQVSFVLITKSTAWRHLVVTKCAVSSAQRTLNGVLYAHETVTSCECSSLKILGRPRISWKPLF